MHINPTVLSLNTLLNTIGFVPFFFWEENYQKLKNLKRKFLRVLKTLMYNHHTCTKNRNMHYILGHKNMFLLQYIAT